MPQGKRDYYEVLGLQRGASDKEIKTAYRKLARKYHPDYNPNDKSAESKFKEINEAYAVLSNPQAKQTYDRFGHAGGPSGQPGFDFSNFDFSNLGGTFTGFGQTFQGGGFEDILGELFGGFGRRSARSGAAGRGRRAPSRGQDVETEMEIDFQEAVTGVTKTVMLEGPNGRETISFATPPGVRDGEKIRLRGKGAPGYGGTAGDLILRIHVRPDENFERDQDNIYVAVGVSIAEAVLGAKVRVPTIEGYTAISLPAGTQGGQVLRIPGKGVKRKNAEAGDLFVRIKIVVPKSVDEKGKDLIRQFDLRHPVKPRPYDD